MSKNHLFYSTLMILGRNWKILYFPIKSIVFNRCFCMRGAPDFPCQKSFVLLVFFAKMGLAEAFGEGPGAGIIAAA